jgi:hypothetical protein
MVSALSFERTMTVTAATVEMKGQARAAVKVHARRHWPARSRRLLCPRHVGPDTGSALLAATAPA